MLKRVTQLNSNFFLSTNSDLTIQLNKQNINNGTSRSRNYYQNFDPILSK